MHRYWYLSNLLTNTLTSLIMNLTFKSEFNHDICSANQLTCFYMMATLAFNELIFVVCTVLF